MCGVNGIFAYNTPAQAPSEAELLATRDAMRNRGPDGAGAWWSKDRRCAFGHRRLSILDLSEAGAQPMISGDGRFVVTFNGEIYNYPELRKTLEGRGITFRSNCDTEALLHLYALDGPAMVDRLRGMFAFAIWDNLRRELFLARDPYGIKPLYYANDGWTFRFASQVKSLLAGGKVSRDPEPAGFVGFHLWGHVPEPFTLYREIRALPAGHTMIVDSLAPREPMPYARIVEALGCRAKRPNAATLVEEVRDGVLNSVRHHLLADVEVGVFLSAGIDSGALTGLMRDAGQQDIRAITLGFEEFEGTSEDEAPFAAEVARLYGARHVVRRVSQAEFESDLPAIFAAMDQPSIDGVNTWFVAKAAREHGLKVAISGLGGDELFAGYPSFQDIPRWRRLYGPMAAIPGLGRIARVILAVVAPGFAALQPKALGLLEYAGSDSGAYLIRRGLFLPHELCGLVDPELVREGLRRLRPIWRLKATITPDPGTQTARIAALESSHYMRDQLLRDADWAGMAHGIEIRTPLVDFTLLQRLGPTIRTLKANHGKAALAQAPQTPLPEAIIARAKTGFSVPIGAWTLATAGIRSRPVYKLPTKGLASREWSRTMLYKGQFLSVDSFNRHSASVKPNE